eukprot:CAMPEP_0201099212 /NCGR_PEP_ID=MMETSP0812-20130820/8221_1 /ASSEMBLY_ACC=CAM_ASM_000668 /TAXON_ID=98059 /ORGANISM="Dinobryon sp., Strain UTEXLB2267" /LENGTH=469 /DNA_ID=CAMNT_0047355019 /DNA_START=530 /DNA_END=1936 /DNA_ORIENTATION=+
MSIAQEKEVMTLLRFIAKRGHTIILKTEHLRASLLTSVDDVTIIGDKTELHHSNVLYSGTLNDMALYFDSIGISCPAHLNPTDFYRLSGTVDRRSNESIRLSSRRVERLADVFRRRRAREKLHALRWKELLAIRHQPSKFAPLSTNQVLDPVKQHSNGGRRRILQLGLLSHTAGSVRAVRIAATHCWQAANGALCAVRRLHLLAWRQVSQDKGANLARLLSSLLSSLLIGAACVAMGKPVDVAVSGLRLLPAVAANSLVMRCLLPTSRSLERRINPLSSSSSCDDINTTERESAGSSRSSYFFLSRIASKVSLPSIYPCMHALIVQDLRTVHRAASSLVMFVFVHIIESLACALLRMSVVPFIPAAQATTVIAPAALLLWRVVRILKLAASSQLPVAASSAMSLTSKARFSEWLWKASGGVTLLSLLTRFLLQGGVGPLLTNALQLQGGLVVASYMHACLSGQIQQGRW